MFLLALLLVVWRVAGVITWSWWIVGPLAFVLIAIGQAIAEIVKNLKAASTILTILKEELRS